MTPALHQTQCGANVARGVYRMLKYKVEYETISIEEYEAKYKEQQTCAEPVEASST